MLKMMAVKFTVRRHVNNLVMPTGIVEGGYQSSRKLFSAGNELFKSDGLGHRRVVKKYHNGPAGLQINQVGHGGVNARPVHILPFFVAIQRPNAFSLKR